jgi:hypothetical protein
MFFESSFDGRSHGGWVVRSENKCHERLPSADSELGFEQFRVFGLNTAKRLNTLKPPIV